MHLPYSLIYLQTTVPNEPNTPSAIHIRYATSSDNTLLADLGARTFRDTFAADNTPEDMAAYLAASFNPQKQAGEINDPFARFLIAEIDGTPAGYAHLKLGPAPAVVVARKPVEIARIYADTPWIGKGIGARLMGACLAIADREGCDIVWLGVWERNARAIAFYRKWGFEEVGRQTFQLGTDLQTDLIMARTTFIKQTA